MPSALDTYVAGGYRIDSYTMLSPFRCKILRQLNYRGLASVVRRANETLFSVS